ncbi:MAG: CoA ester lyase [Xanthobacteraceae bacterium]|nr:CoA ester lyase [Xanthobacteraceae bacterium]
MRSFLFIPGDSPKKLEKGLGSGADALLLDLEDSISPQNKAQARGVTLGFLKEAVPVKARPRIYVRINGLQTGLTDADLDAIVGGRPDGVMFPKAEGGQAVIHCDAKLTAREAIHGLPDGSLDIIAIATETAQAIFLAGTYAGSSKRLKGITWGAEDLSVELGAEANRDRDGHFLAPYQLARSLCLAGAAAAQVQAIDTVYIDFRNEAGLRRECEEARRDGFTGKMAIHPGQVAAINEVFTPTADQVKRAEAVIAEFAKNPGAGTVGIGGVMYDRPHLERAKQLLARAKAVQK